MSLPNLGRRLVGPVGLSVLGVTALAWYISLSTSDSLMSLTLARPVTLGLGGLLVFYSLMTTMMVAMMLPATVPMIMGYRQLLASRSAASAGAPARFGAVAFLVPYVLVWGGFGVLALVGLGFLGMMGPMMGLEVLVPGLILIAAGAYQFTTVKQACLRQCQSPFAFVLGRWRRGLGGTFRMGVSHSVFCVGCCWMFMLALFVVGAMSLLWMGAVSVMIFVEKVGLGRKYLPRGIGLALVSLGLIASIQALFMI